MTKQWIAMLTLVAALGLTGCEDEEQIVETNRLEGVMAGTSTRDTVERPVVFIASEGRFLAIEFDSDGSSSTDSAFYDGTYTVTNGSLAASSVRIYRANVNKPFLRGYSETATVTGTATNQEWQLSIAGASTTTLDLSHDPIDREDSSLARITGTWHYDDGVDTSALSIDGAGNSGTANSSGCASDGDVSIVDSRYNVYDVATVVTDASGTCPNPVEGNYSGFLVYFGTPAPPDVFVVVSKKSTPASTTNDYMAAYLYTKQPSP